MGTTVPYAGSWERTAPTFAADVLLEAYAEAEVDELSARVGVDLLMFASQLLLDENELDRAARHDAAADMLAEDPELYTAVLRALAATMRANNPDPALPTTTARLAGVTPRRAVAA